MMQDAGQSPRGCSRFLVLAVLWLAGCAPAATPPAPPANTKQPGVVPAAGVDQPAVAASSKPAPRLLRESWDSCFMQGQRVGYQRTRIREVEVNGESLARVDQEMVMRLRRDADVAEQRVLFNSLETFSGDVRQCESQILGGPQPQITRVRVNDDSATVSTSTAGKTVEEKLEWPADVRGSLFAEQSLIDKPLAPGERRSMKCFAPLFNQISEVELKAIDYEPTEVLGTALELLRIERRERVPGSELPLTVVWCDRSGEVIKMAVEQMQYTMYRTTKEAALGEIDPTRLDLNAATKASIASPSRNPHDCRRATYRVRLEHGDPSKAFAVGISQRVEPVDEHTADVTVLAVRPGDKLDPDPSADATPTDADIAPNNLIQSDDEQVIALAREAIGDETDAWKKAVALTRHVRQVITQKDYRTALATAAEVARTRSGDCTEHAMLLAAMGRAAGLPARVATGLVYVEREQAFMFHMWTEMFVEGIWVPLDGTRGAPGIGCGHLKLTRSNLKGSSAYASFLSVAQVLGQLKIEALEIE